MTSSLIGFGPTPSDGWTVRRCPVHEIVATSDEHCPVTIDYSSCGLRLSEPFRVVLADA